MIKYSQNPTKVKQKCKKWNCFFYLHELFPYRRKNLCLTKKRCLLQCFRTSKNFTYNYILRSMVKIKFCNISNDYLSLLFWKIKQHLIDLFFSQ